LLTDEPLGAGKRWVIVAPGGNRSTSLLLARATTPEQAASVGNQTGGRVFMFLHTDNIGRDRSAMEQHGVRFLEATRHESYGNVAVFLDLYGNKWDLVEPRC
jgi:hypothetical protein